jgi:hypothetical protein
MSPIFQLLRQAIQQKKQVTADYHGYRREMCPHTLGWKHGKEKALLYQFGGGSKSGLAPVGSPDNWRCLFVSELSNVQIIDGAWFTAPNHSRPQTCADEIDCEVTF